MKENKNVFFFSPQSPDLLQTSNLKSFIFSVKNS